MTPRLMLLDEVRPDCDGYLEADALAALPARRRWRLGGALNSAESRDGGIYKLHRRFTPEHYPDPGKMYDLLLEMAGAGIVRPTSYADAFHKLYYSPRVKASVNNLFRPYFYGAWQEGRRLGYTPGHVRQYDIRSAYRWAALMGLPDPTTYRFTRGTVQRPGLLVIRLGAVSPRLPYPFAAGATVAATHDEIEAYGLAGDIVGGITWRRDTPPRPMEAALDAWTFSKQVGRSFWGRWGATSGVTAETLDDAGHIRTSRQMPSMLLNLPWALLIIARVRLRLWEHAQDALRVYVDSVLTKERLPTGSAVGAWREVASFPDGVTVHNAALFTPGNPSARM